MEPTQSDPREDEKFFDRKDPRVIAAIDAILVACFESGALVAVDGNEIHENTSLSLRLLNLSAKGTEEKHVFLDRVVRVMPACIKQRPTLGIEGIFALLCGLAFSIDNEYSTELPKPPTLN